MDRLGVLASSLDTCCGHLRTALAPLCLGILAWAQGPAAFGPPVEARASPCCLEARSLARGLLAPSNFNTNCCIYEAPAVCREESHMGRGGCCPRRRSPSAGCLRLDWVWQGSEWPLGPRRPRCQAQLPGCHLKRLLLVALW